MDRGQQPTFKGRVAVVYAVTVGSLAACLLRYPITGM